MERTLAGFLSQLVSLSARQPVLVTLRTPIGSTPARTRACSRPSSGFRRCRFFWSLPPAPSSSRTGWACHTPHFQTLNRLSDPVRIADRTPDRRQAAARTSLAADRRAHRRSAAVCRGAHADRCRRRVTCARAPIAMCSMARCPELALPATLQGSLLARLDRLGAVRRCAGSGGHRSRICLRAACPRRNRTCEAELAKGLEPLVASGLVQQRGTPPAASYAFKHALLQDAAYSTLLRSQRQALHARIAEAYDQRLRDIIDTRPELMAHHLAQAGFAERSIGFWLKAARVAIARGAAAEAVAQLAAASPCSARSPIKTTVGGRSSSCRSPSATR